MRRLVQPRCTAVALALREQEDVDGEMALAESIRQRNQAAARNTRLERQTELAIRHSEPTLHEEAERELRCLEDPLIFESRIDALASDPDIGSHTAAYDLEVIDRQAMMWLTAA